MVKYELDSSRFLSLLENIPAEEEACLSDMEKQFFKFSEEKEPNLDDYSFDDLNNFILFLSELSEKFVSYNQKFNIFYASYKRKKGIQKGGKLWW